jgi:alkylation response protein AidB-like acyl-CoA dehydrogenase
MATAREKVDVQAALAEAAELGERFAAGAVERDRAAAFPYEEVAALRASATAALMVPERFGGAGGSYSDMLEATILLSRGDPNIGQMYQLHCGTIWLLLELSSEAVQVEFFDKILQGEMFFTNTYSERGAPRVEMYRARLTRDDGQWRVYGTKSYCTGSLGGDWAFGTARIENTDDDYRIFLIPMDADGVTIVEDWDAIGQRCTASNTVELDGVVVRDDLLFPRENAPEHSATSLLYQLIHIGVFIGIAQSAFAEAVEYIRSGRSRLWYESAAESAGTDPYTMLRVGEMRTLTHAALQLAQASAAKADTFIADPNRESRGEASLLIGEARAFAARAAMQVSEMAFQVCGTSSIASKYGFDRHWRNSRALSLHNPLDYKFHHSGDYELNGTLPPVDAFN